ncbi:MAG: cellulase family glycosylhydrolase [Coriobacteriia bacterium]|nr:cellulase family glycosylhydrolase [Coriobacteriia bacterium]
MIRIQGDRFADEHGRTLILRGVNLGGSSKVPFSPDGATWRREGFFDHRDVSFVGRPFPLEEADEHFGRLRHWGFTFLRLLTTWEAIEHTGPGQYDEAYLTYFRAIVEKAAEYDISVFIDPHQDVWSRFTGGDGAPGWTLEAAGLDMAAFAETGGALTHQEHGDPFPRMIWPTNYGKLANLTMWTLFFGGDVFAPDMRIAGVPAQEYLQGHYIAAVAHLAERLGDLPNVIGFDTLNEPSTGLIGAHDLAGVTFPLKLGPSPTPLQSLALGSGIPQRVGTYELGLTGFKRTGEVELNPHGRSAWLPGAECVWRAHGVWDAEGSTPRVLKPDYFTQIDGHPVEFNRDFYLPFARRFASAIRERMPHAVIFLEGQPESGAALTPAGIENAAYAPHWYDGMTLLRKSHTPWLGADMTTAKVAFGKRRVAASFARQIGALVARGRVELGGIPAVIGECGIPFDMDGKRAYTTGDFSKQTRALDATMRALEANCASFTLWNYTADNTNERGDLWNDEDLSIFSRDQQRGDGSPDDGGRALAAAVRPYAMAVPGEPLSMSFAIRSKAFEFRFRRDPAIPAPAEFFVPASQYPGGAVIDAPDGEVRLEGQLLTYSPRADTAVHTVRITPR